MDHYRRVVLILLSGGPWVGPCVASGTAPSSPKAEAGACEPLSHPKPPNTAGHKGLEAFAEFLACNEKAWTSCKDESVPQAPVRGGSSPTGAGSTKRDTSEPSVSCPTRNCSWKDDCFLKGLNHGLSTIIKLDYAFESAALSRRSALIEVLLDICARLGFSLVCVTGTLFLGGITFELCKAWYGRSPPLAAAAILAAAVNACLTAAAFGRLLGFTSVFPCALSSAAFGCVGALSLGLQPAAAAPRPQDEALQPLAPSAVWPPNLHVESISPSASVPPGFVCPITMAPMANPAITPRGTSYDREALCDWITKHHRYPGGEARAAPAQTSVRSSGAALSPSRTFAGPWNA